MNTVEKENRLARVLDKQTVIDSLKRGAEIRGAPIWGYTLYYGQYDGWTVRGDTLVSLLQKGFVSKEQSKISSYNIYRWKDN